MRFVSWNVNGLRAAIRKGIDEYFQDLAADVVMLQETRTLEEQLPKDWSWPASWTVSLHPAEKKGYSGVATATTLPHTVLAKGKGANSTLKTEKDACSCARSVRLFASTPTCPAVQTKTNVNDSRRIGWRNGGVLSALTLTTNARWWCAVT